MEKTERKEALIALAKNYVLEGLGGKNFDVIPYDDEVSLRAPLNQGGSTKPLVGKENLRTQWWAPLPDLVGRVELLDVFVNENLTAVTVEFHCEIVKPGCWLRIIDRFKVNSEGKIVDQENFFDPSPLSEGY